MAAGYGVPERRRMNRRATTKEDMPMLNLYIVPPEMPGQDRSVFLPLIQR